MNVDLNTYVILSYLIDISNRRKIFKPKITVIETKTLLKYGIEI